MILSLLRRRYDTLTAAEQKAAAFILAQPSAVAVMTVSQLAQQSGVAPSAVIRLCKSIGLKGFSELKITLAHELAQSECAAELPAFAPGDSPPSVFEKVFASGIQTLRDTLSALDLTAAARMTDALAQAKRIYIFGVGTSSIIATDAQYRFSQFGFPATSCTDVLFMNVTAVNAQPGDAVLCISHSGRTRAVVDALRHAKAAGAATLAVTSFADSPLARESDVSLCVYADEAHYPVESVSSRVAHLCLIDALMMALATRSSEQFAERVHNRNAILREIRY